MLFQSGRNVLEYQNQAKQLFRRMKQGSPAKGSLETGPFLFHYFIERGICFLGLCDKNFSKRLAFAYLEDLSAEFFVQFGARVDTVARPYSFIEFDTYMQKAKKSYMDSRARRNLNAINTELQDVQRIMVQNIDDVLQRGDALSALDDKASNLATMSQKYKKDAHFLNLKSSYAKIAAIIVIVLIFLLFVRYWVF
ncbi:hypothetical protein CAPTEDRAFT_92845 [Capitella teleta]|uniref:Vesicle-trafficking protein SEC22b n=1 Tax=Capitella teleta TaxID=283909 RepID=R7UBF4_CAPTE|nr:hypothetical protein CAPTEDRAFT_92845 [Capitella teleta]|eukprot:ELU03416.1 hypothetical protein CAPTEDRAFT_92845 [Capitella teleta]